MKKVRLEDIPSLISEMVHNGEVFLFIHGKEYKVEHNTSGLTALAIDLIKEYENHLLSFNQVINAYDSAQNGELMSHNDLMFIFDELDTEIIIKTTDEEQEKKVVKLDVNKILATLKKEGEATVLYNDEELTIKHGEIGLNLLACIIIQNNPKKIFSNDKIYEFNEKESGNELPLDILQMVFDEADVVQIVKKEKMIQTLKVQGVDGHGTLKGISSSKEEEISINKESLLVDITLEDISSFEDVDKMIKEKLLKENKLNRVEWTWYTEIQKQNTIFILFDSISGQSDFYANIPTFIQSLEQDREENVRQRIINEDSIWFHKSISMFIEAVLYFKEFSSYNTLYEINASNKTIKSLSLNLNREAVFTQEVSLDRESLPFDETTVDILYNVMSKVRK